MDIYTVIAIIVVVVGVLIVAYLIFLSRGAADLSVRGFGFEGTARKQQSEERPLGDGAIQAGDLSEADASTKVEKRGSTSSSGDGAIDTPGSAKRATLRTDVKKTDDG